MHLLLPVHASCHNTGARRLPPPADAYLPFAFAALSWGPGMVALLIGIASAWAHDCVTCCSLRLRHSSVGCGMSHVPAAWPAPACSDGGGCRADGYRCPAASLFLLTPSSHPPAAPPTSAATWYASVLLASLHEWNGVRYLRYSDLAASIAGG